MSQNLILARLECSLYILEEELKTTTEEDKQRRIQEQIKVFKKEIKKLIK